MSQKITKTLTYYLGVIAVGLVVGLSLQFVRAWSEPILNPPAGNLAAPLNTGAVEQIKTGPLQVDGFINNGDTILTGKVGIGIASTGAMLEVNGRAKIKIPNIPVFSNNGDRNVAIPSPQEGDLVYNKNGSKLNIYVNGAWRNAD